MFLNPNPAQAEQDANAAATATNNRELLALKSEVMRLKQSLEAAQTARELAVAAAVADEKNESAARAEATVTAGHDSLAAQMRASVDAAVKAEKERGDAATKAKLEEVSLDPEA